jgi:transcriptional regulator of acetoin/glycerol metabolism
MDFKRGTAVANEPSGKSPNAGKSRGTLRKRRCFLPENLVQLVLEQAGDLPMRRVCEAIGISRATLYRRLRALAS